METASPSTGETGTAGVGGLPTRMGSGDAMRVPSWASPVADAMTTSQVRRGGAPGERIAKGTHSSCLSSGRFAEGDGGLSRAIVARVASGVGCPRLTGAPRARSSLEPWGHRCHLLLWRWSRVAAADEWRCSSWGPALAELDEYPCCEERGV